MSHLSKIELEVKNLDSLTRACRHMGLELARGQNTFKWYNGNAQCDHAIIIPGADYEIGLVSNDGKYDLMTDFWDSKIENAIGKNGGFLKQRYVVEQTKTASLKKGYRVIEKKTDQGIRLYVRM